MCRATDHQIKMVDVLGESFQVHTIPEDSACRTGDRDVLVRQGLPQLFHQSHEVVDVIRTLTTRVFGFLDI